MRRQQQPQLQSRHCRHRQTKQQTAPPAAVAVAGKQARRAASSYHHHHSTTVRQALQEWWATVVGRISLLMHSQCNKQQQQQQQPPMSPCWSPTRSRGLNLTSVPLPTFKLVGVAIGNGLTDPRPQTRALASTLMLFLQQLYRLAYTALCCSDKAKLVTLLLLAACASQPLVHSGLCCTQT